MAEEKKYTVGVTQPKYWQTIHDMLADDSTENHIPNRKITIFEEKEWSSTRGTFMLTDAEAEELKKHGFVKWVELDPASYPDLYPKPEQATQRWGKEPRHYRDLNDGQGPAGISTNEINRTGWQIIRTGIKSCRDIPGIWQGSGNIPFVNADVDYSLTGKNVDLVVHDSGVQQYHPEFMKDGKSRVRDLVLDGPEVIDPDWFNSAWANPSKYTKADGRVGIATTSAIEWWRFSNKRSAQFSSIGVINSTTFSTYTQNNAVGTSGTTNNIGGGHGTGVAAVMAGNDHGIAFGATIWNAPSVGDNCGMSAIHIYELLTLWHENKPINPGIGTKNPTLVNGSWGYQACFTSSSTAINYTFKGNNGTFGATDATTDLPTAWKNGLNNQVQGAYKSWTSSARSNSTDAAGAEMMSTGLHYVAAAGNNNQYLGIGSMDPHRLDRIEDLGFGAGDPRAEFGGFYTPASHRDWLNPQGLGFDETNDWHPSICVGAMEDNIGICNGGTWCGGINGSYYEYKAAYSNNGPGIDVWAPADETLAAGLNGDASYEDFQRADDGITYTGSTNSNEYYDCSFNGTSAASPVAAGVLALYLEVNPRATQRELKEWLQKKGSVMLDRSKYIDMYIDETTNDYWSASWNLRKAEGRVIYNPYANSGITSVNLGAGGKVSGPLTLKNLWS